MRPRVDITWSLDGRIRDLAEERGIDRDEAYRLVIETGLDELESENDPG